MLNVSKYEFEKKKRKKKRKKQFGFLTRSDINQPVQSQEQARSLKFWIEVEEELYYPSSENKSADQLCSYCEADLRLCFRIINCWFSDAAAQLL